MTTYYRTPRCGMCQEASDVEVDEAKLRRWKAGELIQNVWPEKSADERELLITGTHAECWAKMFSGEEE